jgi:hypothetical protein
VKVGGTSRNGGGYRAFDSYEMYEKEFGERPWGPESEDDNTRLEQATLIVSRAREQVARQRDIIAELKTMGLDTKSAEDYLLYLERSLRTLENELMKIPKREG